MKLPHFILAAGIVLSSCAYNDSSSGEVSCNGVEVSFSEDVMPIIQASCTINSSCHSYASIEGPGPFTNYAQISAAKADIQAAVTSGAMPKNSSLTATERNTIVCWVRNGGLNN